MPSSARADVGIRPYNRTGYDEDKSFAQLFSESCRQVRGSNRRKRYPLRAAHRKVTSKLRRVSPDKASSSAVERRNESGTAEVYYAFVSCLQRQRRFYFVESIHESPA